ncbi:hypothetical protein CE91St36_03030 [Christensenellaceae bacterium]|nr:hypothetical protein CE91St36_03030 [Christensenellaceae bacterium]BDF60154.1 hypothetical protein CE91St37_03040 [Christensenellaceae bacterium]
MFYVKQKISEDAEIRIDITDENVFAICPECGKEISVDLADIFSDGEGDLFGTSVFCEACTKKRLAEREIYK